VGAQRALQLKSNKSTGGDTKVLVKVNHKWWGIVYGLSFPLSLVLLSCTAAIGTSYRVLLWAMAILPLLLVPKTGALHEFWTSPLSFGVRGCLIAILVLTSAGEDLEFLSMVSFALAAWFSCALGSIGSWTAYLEYGEFKEDKRHILSIIQAYFVVGFSFQVTSALMRE